jgi:DNA-binding transcriptional MerR regulator
VQSQGQFLSVEEVSRKVRVPKHTLRCWEKELGDMITPQKTRGGQRRYRPEDLSIVKQVRNFRLQGLSFSEIRERFFNDSEENDLTEL